jgi:hypothetical protein
MLLNEGSFELLSWTEAGLLWAEEKVIIGTDTWVWDFAPIWKESFVRLKISFVIVHMWNIKQLIYKQTTTYKVNNMQKWKDNETWITLSCEGQE